MAVRAPDFRPDLDWINTGGRALSLADFRGRVLLLDFWTYGCINCIHMIPELAEVERRFPEEIVVVGIHSGKFVNERVSENIARACERLGVHHPVLNDRQFRTWREYAVNAWPTLVVVSPDGYVIGTHRGEVTADQLTPPLERALDAARAKGTLRPSPEHFYVPSELPPSPGLLRFPAKVHAATENRIFVADTGHHRILEVALDAGRSRGRIERVMGSGDAGWQDDAASEARFRSPHGLALAGETLYVADTENHLVRAVDLRTGTVTTIAGTGVQARHRSPGGPAREVPLNSPWDLLWSDGLLYIAMAGRHQIWRLHPDEARVEVWAGSGAEELHDASLDRAAMAQPSGLATDGERIHFADPEASAIRWAAEGEGTGTIVGTGLFDFGDRDGVGDEVRLQHALGLAWWGNEQTLLVADTYNHRIKLVDPATREARSFAGLGEPGSGDGAASEASFWEPGGLAISPDGRHAFVADTNNHCLRVIDLATRRVGTVALTG
jgi:sugar lactone lactonase YvrE/thiol-disulfide isomerase/thioredoxin